MTTRTSTRLAGLAAALLASLVVVPTALAIPTASSVANGKLVLQQAPSQRGLAPDRADKLGVLTQGTVGIPDRVDRLGTIGGPGPVTVLSFSKPSTGSSTWTYVLVAAATLLAVTLLIALGTFVGRKRSGGIAVAQ
jgi:amino acid transporter